MPPRSRRCSPPTPTRGAWRGRPRAPDPGRARGRPRSADLRARAGPLPRREGRGDPGLAVLDRLRASDSQLAARGDRVLALLAAARWVREDGGAQDEGVAGG